MKPLLIAFEGVDGAGKSTQADSLAEYLSDNGVDNIKTRWCSGPVMKKAIKKAKRNRNLTPLTYSLTHAADFYDRQDRVVVPALLNGITVVADRWLFTGMARDAARGVPQSYIKSLYSLGRLPDYTFYLKMSLDSAYQRIHDGRQPKYWEAGMDVTGNKDVHESYLMFTQRVMRQYETLAKDYDMYVIDADKGKESVEEQVHKILYPVIGKSSKDASTLHPTVVKPSEILAGRR